MSRVAERNGGEGSGASGGQEAAKPPLSPSSSGRSLPAVPRCRAMNPALNAIVYDYTDDALAEARRADDELAAGRGRGPLHGVPVTIKENVDQQGKPTPNGV